MRWIIGDIHGMFVALDALINQIERRDHSPHLIFVGDYVNRGPDSRKVIDRLLALPRASFVRGNHDDIFDLILHSQSFSSSPDGIDSLAAFTWFMQFGLDQTLVSYGADLAELQWLQTHPNFEKLTQMLRCVPDRHRQFIKDLPGVVDHPDIFVAHAMWNVDESDLAPSIESRLKGEAHLRHQIIWGRYSGEEIHRHKRWKRTGYFGHTPVLNYRDHEKPMPLTGPSIVLLDTAAALVPEGRLTALCADDGQMIQVGRRGELIK